MYLYYFVYLYHFVYVYCISQVPSGTDLLVIAGPRSKDSNKVKRISEKLTDSTLIILLNGRSSALNTLVPKKPLVTPTTTPTATPSTTTPTATPSTTTTTAEEEGAATISYSQWVHDTYTPVFHYAPPVLPPEVEDKREYVIYHEYTGNKKWYLAAKEAGQGGILSAITGGGGGFKTILESDRRISTEDVITSIKGLSV